MSLPDGDDVIAARARITPHIIRTPMLVNAELDRRTGGRILLKPEMLQRTGAFKLRGATNALLCLSEAQRARGVVTYSSGNHGQAIACAAARFGVAATVVMPADAPEIKRRSTEAWGAKVIPYDRANRASREAIAAEIVEKTGATLIPPFDHGDVIAGQGTLALELAEDAAEAGVAMDAMIVCTGGGGLMAGCALALEKVSPGTKLYAAEPEGWEDTARSLVSGVREKNDLSGSPFCDALLTPSPGELTFAVNKSRVTAGLVVSEAEIVEAMRFSVAALKLVVEPGGAVALAAVLSRFDAQGKVVGVTLSGGNVDPRVLAALM